jgi:predicted GH43/DUF377 family glycosyl hydrolase
LKVSLLGLAFLCLTIGYTNCAPVQSAVSSDGGNSALDITKITPGCFQPSVNNPILTSGSLLPGADWNDPSVLKVGTEYVMYASSDQSFDFNIKIYRLKSPDGVNWTLNPSTPVFQANPVASAWDHRAVETPTVIIFQNKYHMFYTGYAANYADTSSYRIGHATSADGITWVRDPNFILAPSNPTGAPNLDFNQFVVAEPGAVVFKNKIYLYFSAIGANTSVGTTLQVIGLTTSSDGVQWTALKSVLQPSQTTYPRSNWIGYSTPQPVVISNALHLFFDVVQASPWKQLRIHRAVSFDGQTNWISDANPIFTQTSFPWASNEIRSPAPMLDGTVVKLWFGGDNGVALGIGFSQCQL